MKALEKQLQFIENKKYDVTWQPELFDIKNNSDAQKVDSLISNGFIDIVVDDFKQQKTELYYVNNPVSLKQGQKPVITTVLNEGIWVYYSWRKTLVHVLNEDEFVVLRTSRNQNLIKKEEQETFQNIRIGIAGLNVGNPGALCIALEGGSHHMKLSDNDILSLSNMNRFRANLCDLGINKALLTARQIYETNPFAKPVVFPEGIIDNNINDFLLNPPIDLLIEETDNLPLKIKLRELAKENNIPVLMVTGNGSNVIIDVERFDLKQDLCLLNGHLRLEVIKEINSLGLKTFDQKIRLARDFMGGEILTDRLNQSFNLIGTQLAGIPQLAEASYMRGAALAWFARNIFIGKEPVTSGRYFLELEKFSDLENG